MEPRVTHVRLTATCAAALGAIALSVSCSREPAATALAAAPAPGGPPATLAASHEPSAPAPAEAATITGAVAETMDAANYTYVRVDTGKESVWAASGTFPVKVGDRVVVPLESPMENFHSQSLNRDFPLIYFASSIWREGEQAQPAMPAGHPPVSGSGARNPAAQVTEKIPPPEGGLSVADVWAKRATLAGKPVTVRGKVVKFNGGIMDRNWIHLQDGSGAAADRTNDLTATTSAVAKVGDIVTVTGTVAVDKDFGAGYSYPVIIEGATLRDK
jgi:hypothetical protein